METMFSPGGMDLSSLSHMEQGTRLRRLKRLFTEGHLFDVKCFSCRDGADVVLFRRW
jgi:hypothetical protein